MKNFNIKYYILLLFTLVSFSRMIAQDTIIKLNNDKVIAKVIEINPTEIKYKKFDYQDGPVYTENKSDIKMIIHSTGVKETFEQEQPKAKNTDYITNTGSPNEITDDIKYYYYHNTRINQEDMQEILMRTKDPEIMNLVNKATTERHRQFIAFAAIPVGIVALLSYADALINSGAFSTVNYSESKAALTVGIIFTAVTISFPTIATVNKNRKTRHNSEAIKLYNEKF